MGTAGGTPCMPCLQALPHRTDGKLYKLQTPQTPLARTARYDQYCMDEFPNGTNMVVAVLAYTGDFWAWSLLMWLLQGSRAAARLPISQQPCGPPVHAPLST